MRKLKLSLIFVTATLMWQCTYHNEDDYFKDNPDICYTDNMSFSTHVQPVIQSNCISCHNNSNTSGGINLSTYENVKTTVESGRLLGAIRHDQGFSPMPQMAAKLPDCTISQIEAWIDQGLKNN